MRRHPNQAREAAADAPAAAAEDFVLYLEGPGDRAIFDGWCRRLVPALAGRLSRTVVLLGGKQPERALEHFRGLGGAAHGRRALCVLDRDHDGEFPDLGAEAGIEFFTWRRRHIESYLLVPGAIERSLRSREHRGRVGRALKPHLPDGEAALQSLDAKRLLAPDGPVARALGRPLSLPKVARATRANELHDDVHDCFARLRQGLGVVDTVVVR